LVELHYDVEMTRGSSPAAGALTLGPLLDQLLDRSGEGGFEVDEFDPRRGDDYPDHAVVERADLGLPLDALLGGHFVAAVYCRYSSAMPSTTSSSLDRG
jgi:hypothetical protein